MPGLILKICGGSKEDGGRVVGPTPRGPAAGHWLLHARRCLLRPAQLTEPCLLSTLILGLGQLREVTPRRPMARLS